MIPADTLANVSAVRALTPLGYVAALALTFTVCSVIGYKSAVALAAYGKDEKGVEVPWALLRTFPTTNGRIMLELALAAFFVVGCMVADMIGHPVGEGTQNTLGLFIAAMLGIGAGQFYGKRKTDADYVTAKNASSATTVVADSVKTGGPTTVVDANASTGGPTT